MLSRAAKLQLQTGDLPVGYRGPYAGLLSVQNRITRFPEDRAHQDRMIARELTQKISRGLCVRRRSVDVPALDERLEVEYRV